jgi:hypothetical protein
MCWKKSSRMLPVNKGKRSDLVMKKQIAFTLTAALLVVLLTGCGASAPASSASDVPAASFSEAAASQPEQSAAFKAGTWLAYGAGEYTYYFFDADGSSGSTARQADDMGLGFTYTVNGTDVVFCMGSADNPAPGTLTVMDEEHLTLQWSEGIQEELTYLSADTADSFRFYSDNDLCDLALAYCKAHAEPTDDLSGLVAATAVNEDGSVGIQDYENLGSHNSTYTWFTVDRQTAVGTDDTTGEAVDLKEG